jgi:hypothetical protein
MLARRWTLLYDYQVMANFDNERRKYPRYDTDLEVYYQVKYDIRTRVEYQVLEGAGAHEVPKRYPGVCRNVSVEGLCFVSKHKLERGDILYLEVYGHNAQEPVKMEGRVCWSYALPGEDTEKELFHTGLQLITVTGKSVADSIYFDKKYKVMWSDTLESLFGNFSSLKK